MKFDATFEILPDDLKNWHDPLLAEELLDLGGAVSYSITDRLTVGLFGRVFLRRYNTRDQNLFGLNVG